MKISFLLGSGISLPAKLPSVTEITDQVLSVDDFVHCADGPYEGFADEKMVEMKEMGSFLRLLKGLAELRHAADVGRVVNYEDLYYMAAQLRDDLNDEFENPALGPLVGLALNSLPGISAVGAGGIFSLGNRAEQAAAYIAGVVADMLDTKSDKLEHLRLLSDAIVDPKIGEATLFTLNHDCLLERFLRREKLEVVDGFEIENALGIRRWNPNFYDSQLAHVSTPTVRVFKLHGSVDWRRFRPRGNNNDNPWSDEYVGIRSNPTLKSAKDENGREHEEFEPALFLAGTFNKMAGYLNHVFLELHYRFHRTLAESSRLVVCGYGFGDKGINNRITDWMCLSPESARRKMILIDPKSLEQIQEMSRGAIGAKLQSWLDAGRFVHLSVGLGSAELNWEKVSGHLSEG